MNKRLIGLGWWMLLAAGTAASAQAATFGCVASGGTNCVARIPDSPQPALVSTISIPASAGTVCSVTQPASLAVTLDVTHSAIGDLTVTLSNPSSATSTLISQLPGASGSCQGGDIHATFQDGHAAATCHALIPSVSGTVAPSTALAPLGGVTGAASGTWTLTVTDTANNGDGALNDWSINVICAATPEATPVNSPAALAVLFTLLALVGAATALRHRRSSDR